MATKQGVQKRRVQAQRRADAHAAAAARKDRRRRLVVGGVAGTLALAMVASVGVGFLAGSGGNPSVDDFQADLDEAPLPVEIVGPEPGAALTGPTPCPATDGTQERSTSFETAPPICIDEDSTYEVSLATDQGEIVVSIDSTDVIATNLFITNSWYGVYDDVPFWLVVEDGLAITGDVGNGNTGFTVVATEASRPYRTGDVIMWADQADQIGSQFAIISTDLIAQSLNSSDPAHPIVGSVIAGSDVVDSIMSVAGSPGGIQPLADIRIGAVTVTETG